MFLSKLDAASLADLAVVSSFAEMATKIEGQEQVFTKLQIKRQKKDENIPTRIFLQRKIMVEEKNIGSSQLIPKEMSIDENYQ